MALPAGAVRSLAPRPMRVIARALEAPETVTLILETGPGGFAFAPGEFVMLGRFGVGEIPISISGGAAPEEIGTLRLTVRGVGAVSRSLIATEPGTFVSVRGPYGTSWPLERAAGRDLIFMTGGLGLAPMRAAIHEATRNADRYRALHLLHGAREPDGVGFAEGIAAWMASGRIDVRVTVDVADPGWRGRVGLVTALLGEIDLDAAATDAFICGPEVMMRFCARALVERGVASDRIAISVERNMECGVGACGRCQLGPFVLCRDGPILPYDRIAHALTIEEL